MNSFLAPQCRLLVAFFCFFTASFFSAALPSLCLVGFPPGGNGWKAEFEGLPRVHAERQKHEEPAEESGIKYLEETQAPRRPTTPHSCPLNQPLNYLFLGGARLNMKMTKCLQNVQLLR